MRVSTLTGTLLASVSAVSAWNTYVVPHTAGADDTPALMAALATGNYSANSTILSVKPSRHSCFRANAGHRFQKGITYNIFTPLTFTKLQNVEVAIEGNLTYPDDVATVQAQVAKSGFSGYWFYFNGGSNITLRGTKDEKWGWVDAHGQAVCGAAAYHFGLVLIIDLYSGGTP
jgi:hypothetical protein